jgi:hypothetical protein
MLDALEGDPNLQGLEAELKDAIALRYHFTHNHDHGLCHTRATATIQQSREGRFSREPSVARPDITTSSRKRQFADAAGQPEWVCNQSLRGSPTTA